MTAIPRIDVDTASREKLIAHIDELEFRLSDVLPASSDVQSIIAFGITRPQCARILACLMKRPVVCSRAHLTFAAGIRDDANRQVDVQIVHLRRMMKVFGITIRNAWGLGFYIDAVDLHRLRSLLSEKAAA